jgi:hypothetical protein
MSSIDNAASAFSADMNGGKSQVDTSSSPAVVSMDDVFSPRQIEQDVQAGGDDTLTDEEIAAARKQRRTPAKAEEDEGDGEDKDPLYADDPAEGEVEEVEEDPDAEENASEDEEGDEEKAAKDDEEVDLDPDLEVEVVVDGKPKKVKLEEALNGYIRTETLHQRLNELNEIKTTMRTEAQALITDREKAAEMLEELASDIESLMPTEPNWDEEYARDATKARQMQKSFEEYGKKVKELRAKRDEARAAVSETQIKQARNFAGSEREKFDGAEENRHWTTDPVKKEKDLKAMVRTAKNLGFTADEIKGTLDSRMLLLLLRASKYDRMVANRPKLAPQGKKNAKPGAGNGQRVRTARKGIGRAQQQLARSGHVDDAAAVFQRLL